MSRRLPAESPDMMPLSEFAALIGVNETTLAASIDRGEAPGYRIGKRIVIPRPAVDDFMHGRWKAEYRPHLVVVQQDKEVAA